ncbi:hypothetical protein ACFSQ0_08315 [Mesonia sediminis]|uniref:Uncharacterized protein n=1 Tax=Mesonia sediminis TaxID=1703946 RepID=A0ABW5SDX5_9FLAO
MSNSYKTFGFLLFLIFGFSTYAQQKPAIQIVGKLVLGQSVQVFQEYNLVFDDVAQDSRCPESVTCVWAGEAKVKLKLYKNTELVAEQILSVSGKGNELASPIFEKYWSPEQQLRLVNLMPYPKAQQPIDKSDYYLQIDTQVKVN